MVFLVDIRANDELQRVVVLHLTDVLALLQRQTEADVEFVRIERVAGFTADEVLAGVRP